MPSVKSPGNPTTKRYTEAGKNQLAQEVKEQRRANEILKKASAHVAQAELDRPQK